MSCVNGKCKETICKNGACHSREFDEKSGEKHSDNQKPSVDEFDKTNGK